MTKKALKQFLGTSIFTVSFQKQDGTIRILNGRLGVKKYLSNNPNKRAYTPNDNTLAVYDIKKKSYRSFNIDSIQYIKANGMILRKFE